MPSSLKRILLIGIAACAYVGVAVVSLRSQGHRRGEDFEAFRAHNVADAVRQYRVARGTWPVSMEALEGELLRAEGVQILVQRGYRFRIEAPSTVIVEWPDARGELRRVTDLGDSRYPR